MGMKRKAKVITAIASKKRHKKRTALLVENFLKKVNLRNFRLRRFSHSKGDLVIFFLLIELCFYPVNESGIHGF